MLDRLQAAAATSRSVAGVAAILEKGRVTTIVFEIADKELEAILSNRVFLYTLFGRLMGEEPTEALLELLRDVQTADELAFFGDTPSHYAELLALAADETTTLDMLLSEYAYFFSGPGSLPSPPWESVHISGRRQIFQESTLDVRNFYRSQGFLPAAYPHVADDHIAIELNFMAALSARSLARLHEKDPTSLEYTLKKQAEFLDTHLLTWIDSFVAGLEHQSRTGPFYILAARSVACFIGKDKELLEELL